MPSLASEAIGDALVARGGVVDASSVMTEYIVVFGVGGEVLHGEDN
jgi:hypothetical protein